jgi:hypothetical protein
MTVFSFLPSRCARVYVLASMCTSIFDFRVTVLNDDQSI